MPLPYWHHHEFIKAQDEISIQEAFSEMASLKHPLFRFDENALKNIEIIPLFEEVKIEINSNLILDEYIKLHHKKFGTIPKYIRPYLARSDPALNAGLVPTILAIKIAPIINEVAHFLPKRCERVLHVGLFGYSRGVGKVKLPRAIGFTAALYSLGVPPELIATGRGIKIKI